MLLRNCFRFAIPAEALGCLEAQRLRGLEAQRIGWKKLWFASDSEVKLVQEFGQILMEFWPKYLLEGVLGVPSDQNWFQEVPRQGQGGFPPHPPQDGPRTMARPDRDGIFCLSSPPSQAKLSEARLSQTKLSWARQKSLDIFNFPPPRLPTL